MTREEVTFNSDELGEIFGSLTVETKKKPQIQAPKAETAPIKETRTLVVLDKFAEMEKMSSTAVKQAVKPDIKKEENIIDTDIDELVRRAEEIEREAKDEKPAPDAKGVEPSGVMEFFEEIRKTFVYELESKIDRKAIDNMMLRTLEKTATSHNVLKNTNWDADGNLRINGTIDTARMFKNLNACPDKNSIDQVMAEALSALLYIRFYSVKQGLGKDVYSALADKLVKRTGIIEAGYGTGMAYYFKNNILKPAILKGDESK